MVSPYFQISQNTLSGYIIEKFDKFLGETHKDDSLITRTAHLGSRILLTVPLTVTASLDIVYAAFKGVFHLITPRFVIFNSKEKICDITSSFALPFLELGAAIQGKNLRAERAYGDIIEPTRWNLSQAIIDRDIQLARRLLKRDPLVENNRNHFHDVFEDSGDHSQVQMKPTMRPKGFVKRTKESPLRLAIIRGELEVVKKICQNRKKEELTEGEAWAAFDLFMYLMRGNDVLHYDKTYTTPKDVYETFLFLIIDQPKIIEILNQSELITYFGPKTGLFQEFMVYVSRRESMASSLTQIVEALHVILITQFPGKTRKELESMKGEFLEYAKRRFVDTTRQIKFSHLLDAVMSI